MTRLRHTIAARTELRAVNPAGELARDAAADVQQPVEQPDLATIAASEALRALAVAEDVRSGGDLAHWCTATEGAEGAASRARWPELLAALLEVGTCLYQLADQWQQAEKACIRVTYLRYRTHDRDAECRSRETLATIFWEAGLLTDYVTELVWLSDLYARSGSTDRAASTQQRVGELYLSNGQPGDALRHLKQANKLLDTLARQHELTNEHPDNRRMDLRIGRAQILTRMGQAHTRCGSLNRARTCWRDALTQVVDINHPAAHASARLIRNLHARWSRPPGKPLGERGDALGDQQGLAGHPCDVCAPPSAADPWLSYPWAGSSAAPSVAWSDS